MAEGAVIFRGRDFRLQFGWRIEAGMRKIEFGEDLTLAELVQRLAGKLFQRLAQQDEADITVFGAGTGSAVSGTEGPALGVRPYYGRFGRA